MIKVRRGKKRGAKRKHNESDTAYIKKRKKDRHVYYCAICKKKCKGRAREGKLCPKHEKIRVANLYKKKCPICGKIFRRREGLNFCGYSCANSRSPSEETKLKTSITCKAFWNTPQGMNAREKKRRWLTNVRAGRIIHEVDREEFAIEIPTVRFEEDFEDYFPDYEKGEEW